MPLFSSPTRESRGTRTNGRLPGRRKYFYHASPLIRRADVSLAAELESPAFPIEKLSRAEGEKLLDFARETSAMRYRELHGFTYGDPAHVIHVHLGRGLEAFVCGVPREHRLPLRAYHAGMFFKNAVPIGYIECLTLFEHMEVGFNLYYTFREGETAWLYARLLRLFRQLLPVACFAVDPYQLGHHNDEAIDSGALRLNVTAANADDLYRVAGQILAIPGMERTNTALVMRNLVGYRITPLLHRAVHGNATE